jgi:hypothetical protein
MKNTIITEFVQIEALQTTTDEQIKLKADVINNFLQQQDGFINAELVKAVEGSIWHFIYHIENFEKLKVIGEKMRSSKMFEEITPLIVPGSLGVSLYTQLKTWQVSSINN